MKKKNIMLLIGYLNNGGAEKSIVKLAHELAIYHKVYFVVAHKDNSDYKTNLEVIEIPELRQMKTKLIGILKIKNYKKKLKIDTSISYTTVFNFVNVVSKYHDKTIVSIRNYLSLKEPEKLYKLLNIISLKLGDVIVCPSKAVKIDQIKNYHANKDKIMVIENFCNPLEIRKLANESVSLSNYIMTISRLEKHKGIIELIKAFNLVVKKNKNLKLLIFGRGPLKEEIINLIKKLNLENNVILKGFDINPFKYLKRSKCFVLASYYEGFSNSIIEAMTCSCPVIAIDSPGGNRETLMDCCYGEVKNKELLTYGILLDKSDERKLADAILKVLDQYDYYSNLSYIRSKKFTFKKNDEVLMIKNGINLIKCSNCGASININDGECKYCHSKIKYLSEWILE